MKNNKILLLFITLTIYLSCNVKFADSIIINAKIYTVNSQNELAKSIVIKDGKILDISNSNLDKEYYSNTIIDAKGKTILPGLIDSHCHFYNLGLNQQVINLRGTKSLNEILEKLIDYDNKNSSKIILGRGWDQNDWENKNFPNNLKLNQLFPNKIVVLERVDGHAYLTNSYTLNLARINENTEISGGSIIKEKGKLSGVLIDKPMQLIDKILPKKSVSEKIMALKEAEKICFSYGLTTVDDAGLGKETIFLIDSLHKSNNLKIKIYAMISVSKENILFFKDYGKIKTPKLNVRSFKVYGDGSLGSRGATLKKSYSDDTSNYGELVTSIKDLEYYSKNISEMGFQMNTHAIGDSTISFLVKNYNTILNKIEDPRWRIEHSQVIDPNDFKLYNNKVLPSVQPTHATSDMYWADERLGERIYGAYAFKDLLNSSKKIALGTDFPVEKVNPFHTFYSSVERKDLSGYPENGFQKENSLNREETLKGMTIWGAYFNFEENEKGSLEIGKAADFIIINQDIMEVNAKLIPKTKVLKTFVDGEMVYNLNN